MNRQKGGTGNKQVLGEGNGRGGGNTSHLGIGCKEVEGSDAEPELLCLGELAKAGAQCNQAVPWDACSTLQQLLAVGRQGRRGCRLGGQHGLTMCPTASPTWLTSHSRHGHGADGSSRCHQAGPPATGCSHQCCRKKLHQIHPWCSLSALWSSWLLLTHLSFSHLMRFIKAKCKVLHLS